MLRKVLVVFELLWLVRKKKEEEEEHHWTWASPRLSLSLTETDWERVKDWVKMATGAGWQQYYNPAGKYSSSAPGMAMEYTQDLHLKMSKKIAQLTKVFCLCVCVFAVWDGWRCTICPSFACTDPASNQPQSIRGPNSSSFEWISVYNYICVHHVSKTSFFQWKRQCAFDKSVKVDWSEICPGHGSSERYILVLRRHVALFKKKTQTPIPKSRLRYLRYNQLWCVLTRRGVPVTTSKFFNSRV